MDQARKNAAESVPPSSHQTVLSTDMYDFCTAPLAADMAKSPSNEDHGMCEDTSDKHVVKAETEEPPCKKQRASLGPSYAAAACIAQSLALLGSLFSVSFLRQACTEEKLRKLCPARLRRSLISVLSMIPLCPL